MIGLVIGIILVVFLAGCNIYQSSVISDLKKDLEHTNVLSREYLKMVEDAQQKTRKYQKENSRLRKKLATPQEDDSIDYLEQYLVNKKTAPKPVFDAGKIEIDVSGRLETIPKEEV